MPRTISRVYLALRPVQMLLHALVSPVNLGVRALAEDADGRVLLVWHSYVDGWHFPGGGADRGEHPADAVLRELREEVGLVKSAAPELLGVYVHKVLWMSSVALFYRVRDVEIDFKPNLEIRAVKFARPEELPPGTGRGVRRRLAEFLRGEPVSKEW